MHEKTNVNLRVLSASVVHPIFFSRVIDPKKKAGPHFTDPPVISSHDRYLSSDGLDACMICWATCEGTSSWCENSMVYTPRPCVMERRLVA